MTQDRDTHPAIDPKDIVLHLRSIHFSLLVACVGLYILVTAGRPEEIDLARSQLGEIVAVVDRWEPDWVESAALAQRAAPAALDTSTDRGAGPIHLRIDRSWTLLPLPQELLDLADPGGGISPTERDGPLWSSLAAPMQRDGQLLPLPRTEFVPDVAPLTLPAPQTPRDFENFWNALGRITLTLTEARWIFPETLGPSDGAIGALPYAETPPADGVTVSMWLEPIADAGQKALWRDQVEHEWTPEYHFIGHLDLAAEEIAVLLPDAARNSDDPAQLLGIPGLQSRSRPASISMVAQADRRDFDAQAAFIDHFGLDWQAGSYALNFPELSAVAESNDDLYFDKVTAFVESKARQSEGELAIFGFSVPAAMVSSWGIPIVLVAQLYFLLHLRSLGQGIGADAGSKLAPWIGVYDDGFARTVAVASAFVLPPATVAIVIAPELNARPAWVLAVLASGLLGLLSFGILRTVWKTLGYSRE
jgi:hypothetical protein